MEFKSYFAECKRVKRVIGGTEVPCGTHKQIVSLRNSNTSTHLCGATILSLRVAITAAHCVKKFTPEIYALHLNNYCTSEDETKPLVRVLEIFIHPNYDEYSSAHDIAMLRLLLEVGDIMWLNNIVLPNSSFGISGKCTIYGYGVKDTTTKETSDILAAAELQLVSLDECTRLLGQYVAPDYNSGMICALGENVDACQGDSGGPLVCAGKIEGVCSYGLSCGIRGIPGVYVSIGAHLNWIRSIMKDIDVSGNSSTRQISMSLCSFNNTYT
ncbi:unnamed protein product, partial [Brenthis ino]